ncbi:MAG: hypothetical protein QNJ72_24885 [Pleurocapsa sp. MO_226.B13]|nr:hypothetical protein [Pleurocapsa sp. MO_226.B13]
MTNLEGGQIFLASNAQVTISYFCPPYQLMTLFGASGAGEAGEE